MAGRDYIRCGECGCKIIYDGDDSGRDRLEEIWGDLKADTWSVSLLCPDCLTKLRQRIAALEKMQQVPKWQPIEMAPKDDTEIYACRKGGVDACIISWDTFFRCWIDPSSGSNLGWIPTHWMPLPEPLK